MHLFANFSSFTEALLRLFEAFGFLFVLVVQKPRYSMVGGFVNFLVLDTKKPGYPGGAV